MAWDRMEMMMGIPPIRIGTTVQNRGPMDSLSEGGGRGGPPEDRDPEDDDGIPRGFRG